MRKLLQEIKSYFKLIDKKTITKWNRGYFLSDDKKIREKEKLFLRLVPKHEIEIIELIRSYPKSKDVIYYVSLLGWGRNVKEISEFLVSVLNHSKSHKVHNYVARALFPLIVSGKIKIRVNEILKLLSHNSSYCKNKALGILAFMPLSNNDKKKLNLCLLDFKKLANSKNETVNKPAKLLLERL